MSDAFDVLADSFDELPPQALRRVAPSGSVETAAIRPSIWRRFIVVFHVSICTLAFS
jgi:hypothetical protein